MFNYKSDSGYGSTSNRNSFHQLIWSANGFNGFISPEQSYCDTWVHLGDVSFENDVEIFASSVDIHNTDGSIFFHASLASGSYSIKLSTTENTTGPIVAYSNYFAYTDAKKYECYISTDAKEWKLMNYETFNDTINHTTKFRFNYKIYENGCYYFKFLSASATTSRSSR